MVEIKRRKKCPHCNSSRITFNEDNEMLCKKCGFVNSSSKKSTLTDFREAAEIKEVEK